MWDKNQLETWNNDNKSSPLINSWLRQKDYKTRIVSLKLSFNQSINDKNVHSVTK